MGDEPATTRRRTVGPKRPADRGHIRADDATMVNCADCGCEILGERTAALVMRGWTLEAGVTPRSVAGRIGGRPYCVVCLGMNTPHFSRRKGA